MNALVVGAGGFVGRYLIDELQRGNYSVFATKLPFERLNAANCTVYDLDICDSSQISEVIEDSRPDVIFHLAALSSVSLSWRNIRRTFDINVTGTLNLLNCVKECGKAIRILLVGSGEEYGFTPDTRMPVNEESPVNPANPYAISKLSQTLLGRMFADNFNIHIVMMRAFNHIGPYQPEGFVVPDFCRQIAAIEKGLSKPLISVGNLSAQRDFTDVRDITAGYAACVSRGLSGQIYNIGSGRALSIENILNILLSFSSVKIEVTADPSKMRPSDVPVVEADISKIKAQTGWEPKIPVEQSLLETLEYWRSRI